MTYSGPSRRTRAFLLWATRLALVAFLVQLSAVDHWNTHFGNVAGVEGSSAHVAHCHGAGDCSTSGESTLAVNAQPMVLPQSAILTLRLKDSATLSPRAAFITPPFEPPQAA